MPKDQMKSEIIDLVLIGDGPLFNHCVNFLQNKNFKIYIITSLNNSKKLNLKKDNFINYKKLYKIKKINFLLSIMNGKIIENEILNKTKYAINFHDGPLPKYGGLYSSSWAILNHEKKHGCCWHEMNKNIDVGNILSFKNFKIDNDDTSYSIDLKSLYYGYNLFEKDIFRYIKKNKIIVKKRNNKLISYYGRSNFKNVPNLGFLNFSKPYEYNSRIFRALTTSKEKKNKIFQPKILTSKGIQIVKSITKVKCENINLNKNLNKIIKTRGYFEFKYNKKCFRIELQNTKVKSLQIKNKNKINYSRYLKFI